MPTLPPIEDNSSNDLKILRGEEEPISNEEETGESTEVKEDEENPPEDDDEIVLDDEDETDEEEGSEEETEEDEDEDKDEDESDEKIGTGYGKPTYRQLVAKYPKIFKDFPGLRNTFFRERDYAKIYPTIEDARESYEQLNRLKAGEQRISQADPGDFIDLLGEYDINKQRKFVQNFLPALLQKNRTAFQAVTEPVIKHMIRSAFNDAKRNGNNNLMNSALNVHEWMFGDDKVEEPARIETKQQRESEPDPEKERLRAENQAILRGQHDNFVSAVLDSSSRSITNIIRKNLPDEVTDFMGRSITRDVMDELANVLRDDPAHRSNMERLIKQAAQSKYAPEWKDRVQSAYLSRAKLALPTIIKKVRSQALKGTTTKPRAIKRATGTDSKVSGKNNGNMNRDVVKAVKSGKMSERDFLNS